MICLVAYPQQKPSSAEVKDARQQAEIFLTNHGQEANRISLELDIYTDRLMLFDDQRNHLFILMAREEYAELLNNKFLALSIGVPHSKAKDNSTFMNMFRYYDQLIMNMKEGKLPKEIAAEVEPSIVMPLLNTIRWRQFHMNGMFENQSAPVFYGCGAVAVGQMMKFYQWPETTKGNFCYKDAGNNLLSINMDGEAIAWGSMKNLFRSHADKDSVSLEPLMKKVGIALKEDFGVGVTRTFTKYIKRAMVDHFGYSPAMYCAESSLSSEYSVIRLVRNELKAGRPSILCGGDHIFVCDGMIEDFLHLNMGWGGSFDGWYRFPVSGTQNSERSFIETAIVNIMPLKDEGLKKTVSVTKAGTLSTLLSGDELANISELKVTGKINGADIRLLKRMSGYIENRYYGEWKGRLTSLDLSDATIITDTAAACTFDAKKINYWVTKNGKTYRFNNITDAEWKEFCSLGENDTQGAKVVKAGDRYWVSFKTFNYSLGPNTFDGCENLERLILPKNTRFISRWAFSACRRLKEITIPSAVSTLVANTFNDCSSLEKIYVCTDSPLLKAKDNLLSAASFTQLKFNPNLRMETDNSLMTHEKAMAVFNQNIRPVPARNNAATKAKRR